MVLLVAVLLLHTQIYGEGDWVTYSEFRNVSSVSTDLRYVYFGSSGGIARYDRLFDGWGYPISVSDGLIGNEILVCSYDRYSDCLWVVTPYGVQKYNPFARSAEVFPDVAQSARGIHSIAVEEKAVWFAGEGRILKFQREDATWSWQASVPSNLEWYGRRSLAMLDSSQYGFLSPYYFLDENLARYEITSVGKDDRHLWVGTNGYGVWRYDLTTFQGEHLLYGLAKRRVDSVARDGDSLWIGGTGGGSNGITLWDRKQDRFRFFETPHIRGLRSESVSSIEIGMDLVGFGTSEGISIYEKKKDAWRSFEAFYEPESDGVISLEQDSSYLFCGTDLGLNVLDTKTWSWEFAPQLGRVRINDILKTGDTLLFATDEGVFFVDGGDTSLKQLSDSYGSLDFGATAIAVDSVGLWFGTHDGIVQLNRMTGRWSRWTVVGHSFIGDVLTLAADGFNLWAGTRWGAFRYSKSKKKWSTYTTQDGLPAPAVLSILTDGDYVWFGSSEGLTRFYWNNPAIAE